MGSETVLEIRSVLAGRPSQPPSDPSGESVEATTLLPSPTVKQQKRPAEADWAVRGGVQDVDAAFDALRPTLAMTFPFELDRFQKEAVIHLEKVHHRPVSVW